MQHTPSWSRLLDEVWTRIVLSSVPALCCGQAVDPRACQLHLQALAALLCTSKQLRAVIQSNEVAAVWSQASVSHHFNWRVWRQLGPAGCDALMRWLVPHAALIKHLHFDLPTTNSQAAQALLAALARAPLTQLSCRLAVRCALPLTQLRRLVVTVDQIVGKEWSWRGGSPPLRVLPALQRLELRARTVQGRRTRHSDSWWKDLACSLLNFIEEEAWPVLTDLVISQTWRVDLLAGYPHWLETEQRRPEAVLEDFMSDLTIKLEQDVFPENLLPSLRTFGVELSLELFDGQIDSGTAGCQGDMCFQAASLVLYEDVAV